MPLNIVLGNSAWMQCQCKIMLLSLSWLKQIMASNHVRHCPDWECLQTFFEKACFFQKQCWKMFSTLGKVGKDYWNCYCESRFSWENYLPFQICQEWLKNLTGFWNSRWKWRDFKKLNSWKDQMLSLATQSESKQNNFWIVFSGLVTKINKNALFGCIDTSKFDPLLLLCLTTSIDDEFIFYLTCISGSWRPARPNAQTSDQIGQRQKRCERRK